MSYLDWNVGDRVVCKDGDWPKGTFPHGIPCPLVAGRVYTIRSVGSGSGLGIDGFSSTIVCVLLDGVENTLNRQGMFDARRFRRIVPRKTDISVFTAMLDKTKTDA